MIDRAGHLVVGRLGEADEDILFRMATASSPLRAAGSSDVRTCWLPAQCAVSACPTPRRPVARHHLLIQGYYLELAVIPT